MFHYRGLSNLFYRDVPRNCTDFLALTGYVGISALEKLDELNFNSTIIYGLFNENKNPVIHNKLTQLHNDRKKIFYPKILCHSKCYLWLDGEEIIKGVVGSANFSSNGLENDYRESLVEVDQRQLRIIKGYIDIIQRSSVECTEVVLGEPEQETEPEPEQVQGKVCEMVLYDPSTGEVQPSTGLNWGLSERGHVRLNDASITIRTDHIRRYPNLFPPLDPVPDPRRRNLLQVIEFIWDDETVMKGRLEGSQPVNGKKYPKQITSFPNKDILGRYIRERIGVPSGQRVTRQDLRNYGRDTITLSLLEEGVYYVDFSPREE